ncbi:unnamed protein product [Scytosiphon promiscuus]
MFLATRRTAVDRAPPCTRKRRGSTFLSCLSPGVELSGTRPSFGGARGCLGECYLRAMTQTASGQRPTACPGHPVVFETSDARSKDGFSIPNRLRTCCTCRKGGASCE